jgi:hypothetical protein
LRGAIIPAPGLAICLVELIGKRQSIDSSPKSLLKMMLSPFSQMAVGWSRSRDFLAAPESCGSVLKLDAGNVADVRRENGKFLSF